MKKWKLYICILILLCIGCGKQTYTTDKITIVTTLFPQYDFARQIVKEKGNVILLLKPGVESHHYDPTPSDITSISSSDLFIYTGEYMETWANTILKGINTSKVNVLDVSKNIPILEYENHNSYDPHIWTSPINAKKIVQTILDEVVKIDPKNKEYYENNAKEYLQQLDELDKEFRNIVQNSNHKTMIFADRFAFHYFVEEYHLDYISAYDSCSKETEPSAKTITEIINKIQQEKISAVFYQEFSNIAVANTISKQTNTKTLLFHSTHNITKEESIQGATYLSLMWQNARNLKEGLQ